VTTSVTTNKTVFHNTTPDLQDQDRFFWSCPKTDGLRPHDWHWWQSEFMDMCKSLVHISSYIITISIL